MKNYTTKTAGKFILFLFLILSTFNSKGQIGEALDFDGVNDYVNLGTTAFKPLTGVTTEGWVYISNWSTSSNCTCFGNTENGGYCIYLEVGFLKATVYRNSGYAIITVPLSSINAGWHHLALTYDGQVMTFYIDGVVAGTNNAGSTYPIFYGFPNNSTILGAEASYTTTAQGDYFQGKLDEIRFWNYARSLCEINNNMNVEINIAPGLLGSYHFNQGVAGGSNLAITTLNDASGNSNTGTLTAMTLTGTTSNWVAPGAMLATDLFSVSNNPVCSGKSATLTAGGASTYTWSPGGSNATSLVVSPTTTTTYTLNSTSAPSGCTNTVVKTLTVLASPTVSIAPSSTVICSANTVTLIASGASTYTWSNSLGNSATVTPGPNANFTRTVTGTAVNGCTSQAVQSISVNTSPVVTITPASTVICSGNSTTLTASGASSYLWLSGPSTASNVVSPAATTIYTVIGTNAVGGCTDNAVQSISVNATPVLTITQTSTVICSGNTTTLTASGANSYAWTSGPTTVAYAISPSSTTIYTVTGTNTAGGCTNTAVRSISVNTTPVVSITPVSTVICSGKTTTLTASGASSYAWTGGPATAAFTVSPGTNTIYTVTGTSANGCTDVAVQSVSVNATPLVTITPISAVICSGNSTTLTASGANSYVWMSGPSTPSYVVSPGTGITYTVTGTNTAGACTNTATQLITVNATPVVSITASSTLICSGKTTTLTAGGATSYVWTSGPSTASNAVSPGATTIYTVTGSSSGCTNTAVQSISVNATPVVSIAPSNTVMCSGNTVTLTAGGANSYVWTSGPSTAFNSVSPGITTIYTVTGTSSGCTNTAVQSVSVNASPIVSISPISVTICSGNSTTLTASGANSYVWVSGPSTASYAVSPGTSTTYTVTGMNTAGACTNTAMQLVTVNSTPVVSVTASSTLICSGKTTTLTAGGATSYVWTSGPSTASNTVSPGTTTIYTVTGASSGCTNTAIQSISVNATPVVSIAASSTVMCSGNSVTLTASGANSYVWTSGPSTTINAVSPGTTTSYTVTGTSTGCTNTAVQSVSVNASPILSITPSSTVICSGESVTLTASGAGTYVWNSGPSTAAYVVSPLANIIYTVTGNLNGCTNTAVQNVSVNASPILTISTTNTVLCSSSTTTLNASGADSYSWSGGPSTFSYAIAPPSTTNYTVVGTNAASGCTSTATQSISVVASLVLTITPSSTVICAGQIATLTVAGASSYTWSGGPATSSYTVNPSSTTIYSVSGTAGTCTSSAVQSVSVNTLPTLSISASSTVICSGNSTTLFPSGASSYTWTGGPATLNYTVAPLSTTIYTLTGTVNACSNTAMQTVSVNATPVLTITPSASVICAGATVTLTGTGAGNYAWTTGPATTSFVANPLSTTIYTLTGTAAISNCTASALQTISVNALPVLTISPASTTICEGSTSNLLANGANNYTWTGGPFTASYAVSPSVTTIYTVTGMTAGCAGIGIATVNVNSNPTLTVNSGTICTGNSFTIIAGGANTYSWSTGATSSSINVSPATNTLYVVTGTGTNNCASTATSNVNVTTFLNVTIAPSATAICPGNSATLTANGANTYSWINVSSTSGSVLVNPMVTTTYSVIGFSGPTCSNTAIQTITIHPTPTISVTGNTLVCAGVTTSLTANGALSYTWNITGPNTSTINVLPSVSSIYTVSGSNFFNCISSSTFQVNTPPAITPEICLVTVDSVSINNEIYWDKSIYPQADTFIVYRESSASIYSAIARISKNDLGFYADTNRSIGLFNGNPNYTSYRYKLQFRDTCGSLSPMSPYHQSIFIQDNQTGNFNWNYYFIEGLGPQLTVNYILYRWNVLTGVTTSVNATGGTAMTDPLYASVAAAGNVKWFVGMSGFACDPNLKISGTTAATISTTKSNNSNEKQYPVLTVGLDKNSAETRNIRIFPNPVENKLTLDFGKTPLTLQLELRDVTGILVNKEEISGNKFYLITENIKNGIYFITLYENDRLINTQKIVVQHQ